MDAQRKTVEGILEFSLCVVELKEESETVQGGSNYIKLCADEWGMSQSTSDTYYQIGIKDVKLTGRAGNLIVY